MTDDVVRPVRKERFCSDSGLFYQLSRFPKISPGDLWGDF